MKHAFASVPFAALLLIAPGCDGEVTLGSGGSGGGSTTSTSTTTSSTTSGTGGGPVASDAGVDAGLVCMPPELPLGDGQTATECACPCSVEAPAILQAMAQAAVAAYQANGVLCASADAVPAGGPPPARCYQPAKAMSADFHTGNATSGWACLETSIAALAEPIHGRFSYFAGSGYLGPAVGGPDPGPMGFEVAAQGDFDGDGVLSTFTITGTIDPVTQKITLTPLFQHDPDE